MVETYLYSKKRIQILYTTFCVSFHAPPITTWYEIDFFFFLHFKLWFFIRKVELIYAKL